VEEPTPVANEQLLEAVSFAAKSSTLKHIWGIGKDIDITIRMTLTHTMEMHFKGIEALNVLLTNSQHSVDRSNSLELTARRKPIIDTHTAIPGVTKVRPARVVAPPSTSFYLGLGAHGIIMVTI